MPAQSAFSSQFFKPILLMKMAGIAAFSVLVIQKLFNSIKTEYILPTIEARNFACQISRWLYYFFLFTWEVVKRALIYWVINTPTAGTGPSKFKNDKLESGLPYESWGTNPLGHHHSCLGECQQDNGVRIKSEVWNSGTQVWWGVD